MLLRILLLALLATAVAVSADTTSIAVTTSARTGSCPGGSSTSAAFNLNGSQSALTLTAGTTYTFTAGASVVGHSFAISTVSGGGSTSGVVTNTLTSSGASFTWTPTAGTYYWVCTFSGHTCMGNTITVQAASTSSGGGGTGTTGGADSSTGTSDASAMLPSVVLSIAAIVLGVLFMRRM